MWPLWARSMSWKISISRRAKPLSHPTATTTKPSLTYKVWLNVFSEDTTCGPSPACSSTSSSVFRWPGYSACTFSGLTPTSTRHSAVAVAEGEANSEPLQTCRMQWEKCWGHEHCAYSHKEMLSVLNRESGLRYYATGANSNDVAHIGISSFRRGKVLFLQCNTERKNDVPGDQWVTIMTTWTHV